MNKLIISTTTAIIFTVPAMAGDGLEAFLSNVNIQAKADLNGFSAKVSAQFGIPEAQVRVVLGKVSEPADAFMVFQLGRLANQPTETVMRVYQSRKSRGWGVMAKELGIKPGSAEFHALKRGDLHFGVEPGDQPISSKGMASIEGKNFGSPDETRRPFEKGKIEVVTVGGLTVYRETLEPGWRWSTHVKPVVGGESCRKFHVKIFLSGRQRIRMDDGTEMEFRAGDVAIMQPGHDAWVVGDESNVLIELADVVTRQK